MNNTISARRAEDVDPERVIVWEQDPTSGEWLATMTFFDPTMNYRLYDLDAIDLFYVSVTLKQYLEGEVAAVYLEPRGSELRRRLHPTL